jgi:translation initiation factor 2 subunit 2
MNYEEMLKKVKQELPKKCDSSERLVIPKAEITTEGKKTIIRNFGEIANTIRRDMKHIAKFLFKALAVPGQIINSYLELNGKPSSALIQQRIDEYIQTYVVCESCCKADTTLEGNTLKCESCGAEKVVKGI